MTTSVRDSNLTYSGHTWDSFQDRHGLDEQLDNEDLARTSTPLFLEGELMTLQAIFAGEFRRLWRDPIKMTSIPEYLMANI
jgi:hypothetical protein